jgi:hypothetical protein
MVIIIHYNKSIYHFKKRTIPGIIDAWKLPGIPPLSPLESSPNPSPMMHRKGPESLKALLSPLEGTYIRAG